MSLKTVAIDARLVAGTSTGDSSYWSGLLHGLSHLDLDLHFLLFSNAARPATISQFRKILLDSPSHEIVEMVELCSISDEGT